MRIVDLTSEYLSEGPGYVQRHPWFFDHYFSFWAKKSQPLSELSPEEIAKRREWVLKSISATKDAFEEMCPKVFEHLEIVLMVGCGTSNGHAFLKAGGKPVTWIALEAYSTEHQARIFVTHEIVHAIQYGADPASAFATYEERLRIGRQTVTEGVASWITASILKLSPEDALWADYLPDAARLSWMGECEKRRTEISQEALDAWNSSNAENALFYANDSSDVLAYRAGYFLGLESIQRFAEENELGPKELLALPYDDIEARVRSDVASMTEGRV